LKGPRARGEHKYPILYDCKELIAKQTKEMLQFKTQYFGSTVTVDNDTSQNADASNPCCKGRLIQMSGTCWFNAFINCFILDTVLSAVVMKNIEQHYKNININKPDWRERLNRIFAKMHSTCPSNPSDIEQEKLFALFNHIHRDNQKYAISNGDISKNLIKDLKLAGEIMDDNFFDQSKIDYSKIMSLLELNYIYINKNTHNDDTINDNTIQSYDILCICTYNKDIPVFENFTLRSAVIITHDNNDKHTHAICGYTCNNDKYIFNSQILNRDQNDKYLYRMKIKDCIKYDWLDINVDDNTPEDIKHFKNYSHLIYVKNSLINHLEPKNPKPRIS
jgi:hypothetical protein